VHSAHRRRVWLVRAAHTLKQRASVRRDEGYYVRQSGRVPAHA